MAAILDIDFSYQKLAASKQTWHPELELVTLIVIATKLSQPFDDIERTPEQDTDASAMKLDWDQWTIIMTDTPTDGLKRGTEAKVKDTDVMGMTEKMMDDYMDWYQRTWLDGREAKS